MCSVSVCCSPDTATRSKSGALMKQPSVFSSLEDQALGGKCSLGDDHPHRDRLAGPGVSRVPRLTEICSHSGALQLPCSSCFPGICSVRLLAAAQKENLHMHGTKYSPPPCLASPSLVFYSVRYVSFVLQGSSPGWGGIGRVCLAQRH